MPSVGNILRGARLQAGLTLEQISARTRISVKILRAIEEDDLAQITSAFFYKSFVRQFGDQLGVPYIQIAESVQAASSFYPEPLPAGSLQAVLARTLVKPRKQRADWRVALASAALIAGLIVCSSFYAFWRQNGKWTEAPAKVSEALETAKSWLPGQSSPAESNKAAQPNPAPAAVTPDATAQATTPATPENGFRVELSAIEASWLSVSADGRQKFNGILHPDQSEVIEGHDTGRMRTGNAGGVKLTFNGRQIGVLGPRGQVRVVVFTKDSYEVLNPGASVALNVIQSPLRILPISWNGVPAPADSVLR